MNSCKKTILLLCRRAPYDGQMAKAGLDIALVASVFELNLSVMFMDEGVWQLLPNHKSKAIASKSIEKSLASFPMYDLDSIFVEQTSLNTRGVDIDMIKVAATPVAENELANFFGQFEQIVNC